MKDRKKPVPPDDLWEGMDKVVEERWGRKPEGSRTVREFATMYNMTKAAAEFRLGKLVREGKVERIVIGRRNYYKPVKG